jgi:hypothetical protein
VVNGGSGYLAGWFDWDDDGNFDELQEQGIGQIVSAGSNTINFIIPTGLDYGPGEPVSARFRLYASEPALAPGGTESPTGGASSGEVEDYILDPDAPTAADIQSFDAVLRVDAGLVIWQTLIEFDNLGFNIYRAESPEGLAIKVNDLLIPSQTFGSLFGAAYTYLDSSAVYGESYFYWLESVSLDGSRNRYGPIQALAADYAIYLPLIR